MNDSQDDEIDPDALYADAKKSIDLLLHSARDGNADASERILDIAGRATIFLASLTIGKERFVGPMDPPGLKKEIPHSIRDRLGECARKRGNWPVIVTTHKRISHNGIFHPRNLPQFLDEIGLGEDLDISKDATTDSRTPEITQIATDVYVKLMPCWKSKDSNYIPTKARETEILAAIGRLPPLLRKGLKNRDHWIGSPTGRAWRKGLRIFLPIYFSTEDWQDAEEFKFLKTRAKRAAKGVKFTPAWFREFIIGELLGQFHSMAGRE